MDSEIRKDSWRRESKYLLTEVIGVNDYYTVRWNTEESPPLANMMQEEVLTLSTPKAGKMNGQDLRAQKLARYLDRKKKPSLPYPNKNKAWAGKRGVFETGVHYSLRLQYLNKPLSSTCLTSLVFVASGSQSFILVTVFSQRVSTRWKEKTTS